MAPDSFARATARNAHSAAQKASRDAASALSLAEDLRRHVLIRQPMFVGRCALCGTACKPRARYCHAHSWAAGT